MGYSSGSCSCSHTTAPILLAKSKKRNNKAKRMICDAAQDHIIPHLTGKAYAFKMWASQCKLYESSNENRIMVLHDRLRGIHMLEDESVTSFLGRYTQIRDELAAVREVVNPSFCGERLPVSGSVYLL